MIKKNSFAGGNKITAAEIIFWYWNDKKEIIILHVGKGLMGGYLICTYNDNPFFSTRFMTIFHTLLRGAANGLPI
jgi:hypothetical protein